MVLNAQVEQFGETTFSPKFGRVFSWLPFNTMFKIMQGAAAVSTSQLAHPPAFGAINIYMFLTFGCYSFLAPIHTLSVVLL